MTPCEAESKGGLCVYRAGHEGPHRYEGGDAEGRYQDALERFRQEKESRVEHWYEDRNNLAALARWMGERGDSVDDIAYMIEKPQKYEDEWRRCQVKAVPS